MGLAEWSHGPRDGARVGGGELRVTRAGLVCRALRAACPARADALEHGQYPSSGRGQVPRAEMGLDQELGGRRQHDQPAGHADQLTQQAAGLLKKDRDGADVPARPGEPTFELRGTGSRCHLSLPFNPCFRSCP
jgi:hypothetical protein